MKFLKSLAIGFVLLSSYLPLAKAGFFSSFEPIATYVFSTDIKTDQTNIEDVFAAVDKRNKDVSKAYQSCSEKLVKLCTKVGMTPKGKITFYDRELIKKNIFSFKCTVKCK
ncbi:MAG: hypothetical protein ACO20H_04015 [Bacteriovoracaceae bacterium]